MYARTASSTRPLCRYPDRQDLLPKRTEARSLADITGMTAASTLAVPDAVVVTRTDPVLDVVVPVFNEQADLERCVRRLHGYLSAWLPYPFRITVADNASTDTTLAIAHRLAGQLAGVQVLHLDAKGRGRALRAAWATSPAPVLAYLDVDLSTD